MDEQNNLIDKAPEMARELRRKMEDWLWTMPIRDVRPALNTSTIKPVTPVSERRMEVWRGGPPDHHGGPRD